ncbi:hypothetical protein K438DRAFT_1957520 [Mycena galopus ATCC 62051]|nr:hypothetical protein K438DRAFT_1957520 [Mycena galopus ATCC 62051]
MTSKQKGKPPGFDVHGILLETTEILETLPVGSMAFRLETEEGEGTLENFDFLTNELESFDELTSSDFESEASDRITPTKAIGDLAAQFAEFALHFSQPFPGDDNEFQAERRFSVYQVSDTEHVVMDNKLDEDVLISSRNLMTPGFTIGLWYARRRQESLGLDVAELEDEERYLCELGDSHCRMAALLLESWFGDKPCASPTRFEVEPTSADTCLVRDNCLQLDRVMPRAYLLNRKFNLVGWFRKYFVESRVASPTQFGSADSHSEDPVDLGPNSASLVMEGESDFEHLSQESHSDLEFEDGSSGSGTDPDMPPLQPATDSDDSDIEFDYSQSDSQNLRSGDRNGEDSDEDSEMPELQDVSDSDISGSDTDSDDSIPPLISVENSEDEWDSEDEQASRHPSFSERPESLRDRKERQLGQVGQWPIGDLLRDGAQAILEFLQPYPGDERVHKDDERRSLPRFNVYWVSETDYLVWDEFSMRYQCCQHDC